MNFIIYNKLKRVKKVFRLKRLRTRSRRGGLIIRGVQPRSYFKKKYRFQLQKYFATMAACGFPSVAISDLIFKNCGPVISYNQWLWSVTALTGVLGLGSVFRGVVLASGFWGGKGALAQPASWVFLNETRSAVPVSSSTVSSLYHNSAVFAAKQTRLLLGLAWGRAWALQLKRLQSGPRWARLVRRIPFNAKIVRRRRRAYFRFRRMRLRRSRVRVPQWIWWRFRPRWRGYWLIKRKWKYQKKFIPVRKMKFAVTLRRAKWVVHARKVAVYTQFRNPARGRWWRSAATYPKRRKYISAGMMRRRLFKERVYTMRQPFPFFNWFYFLAGQGLFNFSEVRPEEEEDVIPVKNMFFLSDGTEVEDWTKGRPDELSYDDIVVSWFKELYKKYKTECMPVDMGIPVYDYMHARLDNFEVFDDWRLSYQASRFFYTSPWALEYIEPKWMKDLAKPKTVTYLFGGYYRPSPKKRFAVGLRPARYV